MGLMVVPTLGAKAPMSAAHDDAAPNQDQVAVLLPEGFLFDDIRRLSDMMLSLPFWLQGVHGGFQLRHGFFQGGAGAGRVQPHIAAQAAAKGVALVQAPASPCG